jgi:hypothetical protein
MNGLARKYLAERARLRHHRRHHLGATTISNERSHDHDTTR